MMKTSIIMPCYNAKDITDLAIDSLFENTTGDFELIIVDNGNEEVVDQKGYPIRMLRNKENQGYPKSMNQGLAIAKGDYLCVVNNDLIFPPNWLERMIAHIEFGRMDMVGPMCNSISGPQQIIVDVYKGKQEFYQVAESYYQNNTGSQMRFHRLVGFCLLFKREVYHKIGGFDEVFSPGNFEDDDYCLRAIQAGFRLGIAQDVYFHHFGSVTHKLLDLDYAKLLGKNQKIFRGMWSEDAIKNLVGKNMEE